MATSYASNPPFSLPYGAPSSSVRFSDERKMDSLPSCDVVAALPSSVVPKASLAKCKEKGIPLTNGRVGFVKRLFVGLSNLRCELSFPSFILCDSLIDMLVLHCFVIIFRS